MPPNAQRDSALELWLVGVRAGGDGSLLAADGHCAAWAIVACADAIVRQTASLGGGYAGHAICDGNIAASAIVAAADTSRTIAALGVDGAARDGDIADTATNGGITRAAGGDVAALNDDIAIRGS